MTAWSRQVDGARLQGHWVLCNKIGMASLSLSNQLPIFLICTWLFDSLVQLVNHSVLVTTI